MAEAKTIPRFGLWDMDRRRLIAATDRLLAHTAQANDTAERLLARLDEGECPEGHALVNGKCSMPAAHNGGVE